MDSLFRSEKTAGESQAFNVSIKASLVRKREELNAILFDTSLPQTHKASVIPMFVTAAFAVNSTDKPRGFGNTDGSKVCERFANVFESNQGEDVRVLNTMHQAGNGIADEADDNCLDETQRTGEYFPGQPQVRPRLEFGAPSRRENACSCRKTIQSQKRILRVFLPCNAFFATRSYLVCLLYESAKE